MDFLLFIIGAGFIALFLLNNWLRTILRRKLVTRLELILAFFACLLPIGALLLNNQQTARFDQMEQLVVGLVAILIIFSVPLVVLELFRKQRLRGSRGIFGLGIAVILFVAAFSFNFVALNANLAAVERARLPTPVNALTGENPCEQALVTLGNTLLQFVATATGLTAEELLGEFVGTGERSVADLVVANGGEPRELVRTIVDFGTPAIERLIAQGCIPANQAAFILSQLEFFVTFSINNDINTLTSFIGGNQTADDSLSSDDAQATRVAIVSGDGASPTPFPTLTPSPTITPTATPTQTRTPFPTPSVTPTRERFVTSTPTLTATLPNPCIARTDFNVNMRDYPSLEDTEVLQSIPFDTVITIYAPNDDKTWWFGEYEGVAGWLSAEFISLTSACDDLPPRRVPPRLD